MMFACRSDKTQAVEPEVQVAAGLSYTLNGCLTPISVQFTNTSINAERYLWQFGDGSTSTETTPTHTWLKSGDYIVTLFAYRKSTVDSMTATVTIPTSSGGPGPTAKFTIYPDDNLKTKMHLINQSSGATTYLLDFGDGASPIADLPDSIVHTYSGAGRFIVFLFAMNNSGGNCFSTTVVIR